MSNEQKLPQGLALIETADGRWFPAFVPLTDTPYWVTIPNTGFLPPAVEPLHDPAEGYSCREEALEACHAWHEATTLSVQWQVLAAQTEVYPERNAWYVDEIVQLIGEGTPTMICGSDAIAAVMVWHPSRKLLTARGCTPDEAIERLYQEVSTWWQHSRHLSAS
ncbi:MAG: hypothetical protein JO202_02025 [Ktedonobacteraceae bacterium]|nr:hypothetical protein [Ktedonobacteraceae bacterium]